VPDTGRLPDLASLTPGELQRTRRDLAAALARPGASARLPIGTHLAAIDAELATRVSQHSQLPAAVPGTGAGPEIEEVRGPLELRALGYREYLINRSRDAGPAVGDGPPSDGGLVVDGDEQGGVGTDQGGVF
jgi:hypothetical protein